MPGTPANAYGWAAVPGGLLGYLLLGGALRPGLTDYWGYLVVQTALALVLLVLAEAWLADAGGLSWAARTLVSASLAADVFGNTARWYARHEAYDQLVHFVSITAITAVLADLLRGLCRRGRLGWSPTARLVLAAAGGVALGLAWEGYEYVGDVVLQTGRSQGRLDTALDVACDALGALFVAGLLSRRADPRRKAVSANRSPWNTAKGGGEADGRGGAR